MSREPEITAKFHRLYFSIAVDHCILSQESKKFHDKQRGKKVKIDGKVFYTKPLSIEEERHAIITIVFCTLALEAFINHYAIERLSKNYLEKYMDKLNPVSKWVIIPRIVTGQQLNPGSKPIQKLEKLVATRNKFVHYKTRRTPLSKFKQLEVADAKLSIDTVKDLLLGLAGIDNHIDTDWVMSRIARGKQLR